MINKKIKKIGWKLSSLNFHLASIRYRCLYPAVTLQREGVESRIFCLSIEKNLQDLDVLVIVKSFKLDDLLLAQQAVGRGIRVVFDLCDNIFIEAYGEENHKHILEVFKAISIYLDAVTVTTQPLADEVIKELPSIPVYIVPDILVDKSLLIDANRLISDVVASERRNAISLKFLRFKEILCQLIYKGPVNNRAIAIAIAIALKNIALNFGKNLIKKIFKKYKNLVIKKQTKVKYAPSLHAKKIVWIGNHGSSYANFGMLDLLKFKSELETVAKEFDVELVIVSNNYSKYVKHIQPLAIPSRYIEWSPDEMERCLIDATLVVIPNSLDRFSFCKSANRTVLALLSGIPVVATPTPALEPLASHIELADPLSGMRRYLRDSVVGRNDAQKGAKVAQQLFGAKVIAKRLLEVFDSLVYEPSSHEDPDAQVLVVLHLIQDLDLALPVIRSIKIDQDLSVIALINKSLIKKSSRVFVAMREEDIKFKILDVNDVTNFCFPKSACVMLTLAETNLFPHKFSRLLTEKANKIGIHTLTMQHGFENVGLTYSDSNQKIESVNFAANQIYIWGKDATLHVDIPAHTRAKCLSVGCPKPSTTVSADLRHLIPEYDTVIGIFENLHWTRYSPTYRNAFLDAIVAVCSAFPNVTFVVKPHHAGVWLTNRHKGNIPHFSNLIIADPQTALWEPYTATALLGRMSAVITTPSTVALDAARMHLPVAVFAYDLSLSNYLPLLLISQQYQLIQFIKDCLTQQIEQYKQASSLFVERVLIPGEVTARIASDIASNIFKNQ